MNWLILFGFGSAVILALAAADVNDRLLMLVYIFLTSVIVGGLFIYVGAIYAGVFHFLVYSGVLTVLFAATAYFVESKDLLGSKEQVLEQVQEVIIQDV